MSKVDIEKYLQLEQDLRRYRKALNEAREIMLDQEITNYPIFVLHQQEIAMGVPVIEAGENVGLWSVHASSLEEFALKNIQDANDKSRLPLSCPAYSPSG